MVGCTCGYIGWEECIGQVSERTVGVWGWVCRMGEWLSRYTRTTYLNGARGKDTTSEGGVCVRVRYARVGGR